MLVKVYGSAVFGVEATTITVEIVITYLSALKKTISLLVSNLWTRYFITFWVI